MITAYRFIEDAPTRGCLIVVEDNKVAATVHIAYDVVEGTHIQSYSDTMAPDEALHHVRSAFAIGNIREEDGKLLASDLSRLDSDDLDYMVGIEILDNLEEMSI